MSGETVTSNALQFTNDNKHAYAYSGPVTITSGAYTDCLEFKTNSEYIVAKFSVSSVETSGSDMYYRIDLNGVRILDQFTNNSYQTYAYGYNPFHFIIPPFSNVVISAQRGSGSDYNVQFVVTGEVGMAPRVGNLVE